MIPPFGPKWDDLELDDVTTYLRDAPAEGLVWEAKGTDVHPGSVRTHACAFANSDAGGFLILGAAQNKRKDCPLDERWTFDGFEFSDEPTTWISNVLGDSLRPAPRIDVKEFSVGEDRHIAVVWVPPVDAPPCLFDGTVLERLPGKTKTVQDPQRLAELYGRGARARQRSRAAADEAALHLMSTMQHAHANAYDDPTEVLDVAVALCPVATASDVAALLFTRGFEERINKGVGILHGEGLGPFQPQVASYPTQSAIVVGAHSDFSDHSWTGMARWDGAVALARSEVAAGHPSAEQLMGHVMRAWDLLEDWAAQLGGRGDRYVTVQLRTHRLEVDEVATLRRGPVPGLLTTSQKAHLEREVRRCCGEPGVYEPGPGE